MSEGLFAPRVVVWKTIWLRPSETFIRNQLDGLSRWVGLGTGFVEFPSPLVSASDTILLRQSSRRSAIALRLLQGYGHSPLLLRYLRKSGAQLVHAHFAGNGFAIQHSAKRAKVPLLVTLHGSDVTAAPRVSGWRGARYRRRLRSLFNDATGLIAVSGYIADAAIALGAPPGKVVVHHIGVELAEYVADESSSRDIDVLFVGRIVEKKGLDQFVRAVARAAVELGTLRVMVVGDGPLLAENQSLARELGIEIEFVGAQENSFVRDAMRNAKVLLVPSVTASNGDAEGLPTVIIEAGANGLPVIGYRHSGIPEAVLHNVTGLLAPERDLAELSKNLILILSNPIIRAQFGRAARRNVEENFDLARQTRLLEQIYDQARGRR